MGIVENTYAELKQQELKNNPYSCLHMADIDINPHQIEAFTFALSSLELGGAILADEVGLGKTIEAGLVIKYLLCSGKNKILLIMPSNLRKQWQVELEEKFDIDSLIVDSSNWEDYLAKVKSKQAVIIVSYHFASKRKTEFGKIAWDFCVFDEAHRLRCGHIAIGEKHAGRHNADVAAGLERAETVACKPFYPPELIIQDELHLITGPLGTIYGGYETVVEEMCCIEKNGKKIRPKYIVSTATIRNAGEQIKFLYGRNEFAQFPPSGFDTRDSFFIKEVPLPTENLVDASEEKISRMISDGKKPFRQYAGICASGQSVKTTLIRLYSIILQTALDIAKEPEYEDYIDPYYTLIGYFNSIRELGGAVRLLDDDIASRIRVVKNKYNSSEQRYLSFEGKKEITSRIPSWDIAQILEKLAISYDKNKEKQGCYDVVIATNMIAVGMDVDRLGLMSVVGQPKQNSEYIQATSRVGRQHPGIIFTVYNPYRPRDLSNYENFVGFHSQMYRYVEGTTATPFAARARDRVLHALVVSLLRLQVETMADNGGASNINDISDEQIKDIKDKILERVKITAPSSYVDTEKEMDEFINTWKNIAKDEKLYYFVPAVADDKKRLLTYYGEYYGDKEKPTLNSMRDVEQSSTVFYWEGV